MDSTPAAPSGLHLTLKGIFMIIFLLVVIAILIGLLIQQRRYRNRVVKTSTRLIGELSYENRALTVQRDAVDANYKALEEGQTELIENYENDFLDLKDKVEAAQNSAAYDRERREEVEKKLEEVNAIVEKHSDKCDILVEDIADMLIKSVLPERE